MKQKLLAVSMSIESLAINSLRFHIETCYKEAMSYER